MSKSPQGYGVCVSLAKDYLRRIFWLELFWIIEGLIRWPVVLVLWSFPQVLSCGVVPCIVWVL